MNAHIWVLSNADTIKDNRQECLFFLGSLVQLGPSFEAGVPSLAAHTPPNQVFSCLFRISSCQVKGNVYRGCQFLMIKPLMPSAHGNDVVGVQAGE